MKISYQWLTRFIQLNETPEELDDLLTQSGLEVEGIETYETIQGGLEGVVIGEVLECEQHPNADKLKVTKVDIGAGEPSPIVCGAPNVAKGQKVIVATVGCTLYPTSGESFKIKKAKIRGEVSEGMICAEDEIGLGASHDGIMILDTDLKNGTPAAEYFDIKNDHVFEIGLTPNRADGASHFGVSRDLKAMLGRETSFEKPELPLKTGNRPIEVIVDNYDACPRYSAIVIDNVEVKESPEWLQHSLKAIGLAPINNIVDITNFVCHGLGQPMHAFDADQIEGNKVTVKTLPKGTKFTTLDEKERELNDFDLMICNETGGMCIAGVFGGIKSGVTEATKTIFLESAYFDPAWVRKTAQAHTLKTDASFRYERGTDPNITVDAIKYAVKYIQELAGGEIASDLVDLYPSPIADFETTVKYKNIDRLIGKQLPKDEISTILESLDIRLEDKTDEQFRAVIPPYRVDVTREADVVEEVLRIHGFNNVELDEFNGADYLADFNEKDPNRIRRTISDVLVGSGFEEILTNSLTNPAYVENTDGFESSDNVNILNKLSEELGVMRQSLVFTGLESLQHNINRRQTNLKFFEMGKVYSMDGEKYIERQGLSLFVTGNKQDESWLQESKPVDFHDLSAVVYKVLNKFNISNFVSEPTESPLYQYGLDIKFNNKIVAGLGKLKGKVTKLAEIKQDVFYADLDWAALLKAYKTGLEYQPVPKFPEVRRDLSLVLDKKVTFEQAKNLAFKTERRLLKRLNVFSVYEGDKIEEGKKAYAINFILQDENKTLNDKQIDKVMANLMRSFEQELKAVIRK
ncbi:MAG: phenylalanine--tRNA ligase subunit beta [bacterium]|nr:phenylalanine--tRNA ligase subunit beta [bacterium]